MRQHRVGALPVVVDEHIVAMLTEEEFVGLASTALSQLPLPASQTDD
jgi:CBS domain-containing protein